MTARCYTQKGVSRYKAWLRKYNKADMSSVNVELLPKNHWSGFKYEITFNPPTPKPNKMTEEQIKEVEYNFPQEAIRFNAWIEGERLKSFYKENQLYFYREDIDDSDKHWTEIYKQWRETL